MKSFFVFKTLNSVQKFQNGQKVLTCLNLCCLKKINPNRGEIFQKIFFFGLKNSETLKPKFKENLLVLTEVWFS